MSEPIKLHDEDRMPFGKFRNVKLGKVPEWYFLWFLKQPWCVQYPDLVQYAKTCEADE